jgi:hypothetical protein
MRDLTVEQVLERVIARLQEHANADLPGDTPSAHEDKRPAQGRSTAP